MANDQAQPTQTVPPQTDPDPQNQSHIEIEPEDPEGVQEPGKPPVYPQNQLPSDRSPEEKAHQVEYADLDFSNIPGHQVHDPQSEEWHNQLTDDAVVQKIKQDNATKEALYQSNPEQFKQQYPYEYLYRKAYGAIENGLVGEATQGINDPRMRDAVAPQVHNLVRAGLRAYNVPEPERDTPEVESGTILPEGEGAAVEEPEIEIMNHDEEPAIPGGHAGGGTVSAEEIKRGKNYLVKPNGEVTYHGARYAPEELKQGQAYVTVGANGEQTVIGDLTPRMKQSLDVAVGPSKKPDFSSLPGHQVHISGKTPTKEEFASEGRQLGLQFRGVQEGIPGKHPGLAIYQDPQSGTSIGVRLDEFSPIKLKSQTVAARERMARGN